MLPAVSLSLSKWTVGNSSERPPLNIFELLQQTKTTRRNEFSDKSIDPEKINQIKEVIFQTANASNRQSYSIIILDKIRIEKLKLPGTKVFIFCIDFNRLQKCAKILDVNFDSHYPMQFITALTDISLLCQSTLLAANSLGIDTMITNEIYHNKLDTIFEILELPKSDVFPMIALCMGYSKIKSNPLKKRLNPNFIFHDNKYKDFSDEAIQKIISKYDNDKMGLINNWSELGYQHYLEWFFEKWSPKIGSMKENDAFIQALQDHKMI